MLAIHAPTLIRLVAAPISWAVASPALLASALRIASKPASSASRAMSRARQPFPVGIARPSRSGMAAPVSRKRGEHRRDDARNSMLELARRSCNVEASAPGQAALGLLQRRQEFVGEGPWQDAVLAWVLE